MTTKKHNETIRAIADFLGVEIVPFDPGPGEASVILNTHDGGYLLTIEMNGKWLGIGAVLNVSEIGIKPRLEIYVHDIKKEGEK